MSDLLPFRTHGEQLADRTAAEIDGFRQLILSDDLLLCEVVAAGKFTWIREYVTRFRGLPAPIDVGERLYEHFCEQVRRRYNAGETDPKKVAGMVLDKAEVKTPATQAEIDRSWRLTTEASEDGFRSRYGPAGDPQAELDKAIDRGRTVRPVEVRETGVPAMTRELETGDYLTADGQRITADDIARPDDPEPAA